MKIYKNPVITDVKILRSNFTHNLNLQLDAERYRNFAMPSNRPNSSSNYLAEEWAFT